MTGSSAALTIAGPLARETFARFCALDLRPDVAAGRARFRPGSVARTPGFVLREDERALPAARSAAAYGGVHVGDRRRGRRPAHLGGAAGRRRRASSSGAARCVTSSASAACGGRARELKDSYDVVIIGGGSHGLATAYYLAQHGITDVAVLEKNYIGSGAAGRNTTILRSNYKTPEGARFYDASREALRGLWRGARLQPAVQPVRAPHARPLRPRDVRDGQPRRGQPPQRHRLAADRPGRGPGSWRPTMYVGRRRRPIRSWARSTTRRAASSATTRWSGASPAAPTRAAPRSTPTPRSRACDRDGRPHRRRADEPRHDQGGAGAQLHGRLDLADLRHGRRRRCRSPPTSSRPA